VREFTSAGLARAEVEAFFMRRAAPYIIFLLLHCGPQAFAEDALAERFPFAAEMISHIFQVQFTEVSGNYWRDDEHYLRSVGKRPWVWDVLRADFREKHFADPWIEQWRFNWAIYPLRVSAEIHEAEPWLVAEFRYGAWLISREGAPLEPLASIHEPDLVMEVSTLPRLDGLEEESHFELAISQLRLFDMAGGSAFEHATALGNDGVLIRSSDAAFPELLVKIENFEQARTVVEELTSALRDLNQRGEHPRRLDLRFKNRAVITQP
jgi:hypothetical protein